MNRTPDRRRSPRARALAVLAAAGLALGALPAAAALYKWTDANGRIVYADQPPTGGIRYEVIGAAPPPDNPNAVKEMATREMELKKGQRERAEEAKKAETARADASKRADICAQARASVRNYQAAEGAVMTTVNEKGERVPLEAAERQRRLAEQQRLAREYCPG